MCIRDRNYRELRAELVARGHLLSSETDTEVLAHLIEELFTGDLAEATRAALRRVEGAYALVVISADQPDTIVGARRNAPLVAAFGDGEAFLSSDITALIRARDAPGRDGAAPGRWGASRRRHRPGRPPSPAPPRPGSRPRRGW